MSEPHVSSTDLELYVIDALEPVRAAEVERHVASCAACERALMGEARLELAFEQLARPNGHDAGRVAALNPKKSARVVRAAPFAGGAVGALAMAAAAVLWIAPAATRHAAGASALAPPPSVAAELDSAAREEAPRGKVGDAAPTARLDGTRGSDELDGG